MEYHQPDTLSGKKVAISNFTFPCLAGKFQFYKKKHFACFQNSPVPPLMTQE